MDLLEKLKFQNFEINVAITPIPARLRFNTFATT